MESLKEGYYGCSKTERQGKIFDQGKKGMQCVDGPNRSGSDSSTELRKFTIQQVFAELEDGIYKALARYSNVHRGTGHHSMISTRLFDFARDIVLEYLGLDKKEYIVIFVDSRKREIFKNRLKDVSGYHEIFSRDIGLPLGTGAIAVKKNTLPKGVPFQTGGGTVKLVSQNFVQWADFPD